MLGPVAAKNGFDKLMVFTVRPDDWHPDVQNDGVPHDASSPERSPRSCEVQPKSKRLEGDPRALRTPEAAKICGFSATVKRVECSADRIEGD